MVTRQADALASDGLLNARHRLADDVHRRLRNAVIAFALIGLPLAALLTRAVIQSSLS